MANFNNIKHEIDQNVNTNGVQAITGAILNETLKDMIDEVDDKKQDTLVAGQNITISGNVISATGGGSGVEYIAGNGIDIDQLGGSVYRISVDASDLAGSGLEVDEFGALKTDPSVVQGKITAGDGITISQQNEISAYIGSGLSIDPQIRCITVNPSDLVNGSSGIMVDNGYLAIDPSVVATQSDLQGYLPLEGGVLQQDSGVDTTLQVIDPDSEDYVKLVAPDAGDNPHIEIFENGSGDTKIYYDKIHSGNWDLNFPTLTQDETIATVSDLNTATSGLQPALTAGDGIEIDANNEISVKAGTGLGFDANGYLINTGGGGGGTTYTAGNGIEIDQNDAINAKLGSGLQLDQNNNIEIDPTVVATQSDLSSYATQTDLQGYLPLTGGNLQSNYLSTEVRVKSPSDDSYVYLHAVDTGSPTIKFHNDIQNPTNGEVHEITLHNERLDIERWDQSGNTWMADTLYFPQFKTGTIALTSDLAGKQDTLTAGTGITIQNNVISATGGGGSGLWSSGTGTNSLLSPSAVASSATASGTGALNAGYYNGQSGYASFANGDYSANFGTNNKVSYANSFASGLGNTTGGHEAFVGGGASNNAHGDCSAVIGGTFGTANGDNSVVIASGANGTANGSHSVAIGNATASGYGAIAIGEESSTNANHAIAIAGADATGVNSVAIGKKAGANNENEIGLGFANKVYTSGTGSIKSAFTVGNGTFSNGNYTYSNGLELKGNSDFYVYGVGGFDGTNSYNGNNSGNRAKTLQEVLNDKQDTLTAGTGISISGNVISATGGSGNYLPLTGGALQADPNDYPQTNLEVYSPDSASFGYIYSYSEDTSDPQNPIPASVEIGLSGQPSGSTDATQGIYLRSNGTIAVDYLDSQGNSEMVELEFPRKASGQTYTIATLDDIQGGSGNYLPLTGGSLQQDPSSYSSTQLLVESPNQYSTVAIESVDLDPGNTAESMAKITLSDYDDQNNQHSVVFYSTGIGTGNYKISFPTPTQNDTFALLSDIQGGGGSGLWTSGTGTGSVMSPGATQANGNYSVSGGDGTRANGTGSVALGGNTTASGTYSTALGAGSSATNSYTVAIGHGVQAANQNETALGAFNLYTNSGTSAQKTFFTVGNGTGTNAKSNLIEAKENNDIYVVGVGNYDGTNAGATGVQTLQDAINNGGGGSYLPLTGGLLKDTTVGATETLLDIQAPDSTGALSFTADTLAAMIQMSADRDDANVADGTTYGINFDNSGDVDILVKTVNPLDPTDISTTTYTQTFQQKSGTIALLSDISGGGTTYTAGTGISISAQNVISNSAPDPGFWVAGDNLGGIKDSRASTCKGADATAIGPGSFVNGYQSTAIAGGQVGNISNAKSTCTAVGSGAYCNANNTTAFGIGTRAFNQYESSVGTYANSITGGTNAENTQFTIGNGSSNASRSNLLEAKQNNDIYVVGVGGFDGTNAGSAGVHTLQYAIANAGGGGGSSLWTSGTGTDSVVAPGTVSAGLTGDAAGTGAVSCGYDSNANGDYSFASGGASTADGDYSFVANNGTAAGDYSAAFNTSGANGNYSFAAGYGSIAGPDYSVALGGGNVVFDDSDPDNIIDAQYGVAIGDSSMAEGPHAAAIAGGVSRGNYSFAASTGIAEGHYSTGLSGGDSVGEGSLASGFGSVAFGYSSAALGLELMTYDQADGTDFTDPNAGEAAFGRYNYSEQDIIFSIGCGHHEPPVDPSDGSDLGTDVRENAITITNDGKIYLKGLGGYTGTSVSGCTDLVSFLNNL